MNEPSPTVVRRFVLSVDVARLRVDAADAWRSLAWRSDDAELERIGAQGGGALGFAWIAERERTSPQRASPIVISVGDCVRRGLPTAARASVASRAPLTGLFAEGLVGGDFARRLASVADALAVDSSEVAPAPRGDVLVLDTDGRVRLETLPELGGVSARRAQATLRARFGDVAVLAIGPAGEAGVALANLASSGETPHFVGRGGLGAVLGRMGLKAICILAPPVAARPDAELTRALLASPRLAERARAGTLELFDALQASADLKARGHSQPAGAADVHELDAAIEGAKQSSHGCHGCPTPCGWVFRTPGGEPQGARFGASYALGLNLGLASFDDALELLRECDELGVDAKEAGAALALLATAVEQGKLDQGPRFGDRSSFVDVLRASVEPNGPQDASRVPSLRDGAAKLAEHLGLEREFTGAKRASVRPDENLASLLGQCVSSRGGDPMRTFPFASSDAIDLRAWCASAGVALAEEAFDPRSPVGKGALVAWHEDWSNALDASGFCSFSAAALLCDGLVDLHGLERILTPGLVALEGAGALLRFGTRLSLAQRALNARWGAEDSDERPAWARERLDAPGMWPEYAAIRARQRAGEHPRAIDLQRDFPPSGAVLATDRGRVRVRSSGALASLLGAERELELDLPCRGMDVLVALAQQVPSAAASLTRGDRALASLFRSGTLVGPRSAVRAGDELDLVAVISGG